MVKILYEIPEATYFRYQMAEGLVRMLIFVMCFTIMLVMVQYTSSWLVGSLMAALLLARRAWILLLGSAESVRITVFGS